MLILYALFLGKDAHKIRNIVERAQSHRVVSTISSRHLQNVLVVIHCDWPGIAETFSKLVGQDVPELVHSRCVLRCASQGPFASLIQSKKP